MKHYNYKNPNRFFREPLMRYVFTPMVICLIQLGIVAALSVAFFNDDGCKWICSTPIGNVYVTANFVIALGSLILYTILYYGRGWYNQEKWGIKYDQDTKKEIQKVGPITDKAVDHLLRNVLIGIAITTLVVYGLWCQIHYGLADNIDCSLLTKPGISYPQNSDIGLIVGGQTLTVQQTRDLCFDMYTIKKYEICYYVQCSSDINQTVNFEGKPIQHSLFKPQEIHKYPGPNEKFTFYDVHAWLGGVIVMFVVVPGFMIGVMLWMLRDPKPSRKSPI